MIKKQFRYLFRILSETFKLFLTEKEKKKAMFSTLKQQKMP